MFEGGQTVTFGKVMSSIDIVSTVVITGLFAQFSKLSLIMMPAAVKPLMTTHTQNALLKDLVWEMNPSPCIEEFSRKLVNKSMVARGVDECSLNLLSVHQKMDSIK